MGARKGGNRRRSPHPPRKIKNIFFWLHGSHFATVFWPVGVLFSPCEGPLTTMVQNISTLPDNITSRSDWNTDNNPTEYYIQVI